MRLNPVSEGLITHLRTRVSLACFKDIEPKYLSEPRGLFHGVAGLVLAPKDVFEVSEIVRACNKFRVAIIPYGGGTGLVGGQVSTDLPAPVILSLERMKKIRDVDIKGNVIQVEAGCLLASVQDAAADAGRLFPLSLASEGSCQIGGNLSTNAGGVGVLRYGNARDLCLGIEAVLPDGSIWNGLKKLRKDNTGYDLKNLLIGAEGSLGIITAASLKLMPKPNRFTAAFLQIRDPEAALELLEECQAKLGGAVSAFELIHRQGVAFLKEKLPQVRLPFAEPSEWMLLIDLGICGELDLVAPFENLLAQGLQNGLVLDALIAQNENQRQEFWNLRESIPEANRLVGAIYSHDISVPIGRLPEFIDRAGRLITGFGTFRINCFGHVGDGNLHYNIYPPTGRNRAEFQDVREQIKDSIYGLVTQLGGSISAEHGIGRMKIDDMQKYGDPVKLAALRAIKSALDPNDIMNPGAVVPMSEPLQRKCAPPTSDGAQ
jgi:FAD/FMN-containing dehydrogenase